MLERLGRFCLFNPCFLLAAVLATLLGACWRPERPTVKFQQERPVEVTGWITQAPQALPGYLYLELSPLTVHQNHTLIPYPARLVVTISSSQGAPQDFFHPPLSYGEILRFETFLQDPSFYALPEVHDYRQHLWQKGLLHVASLKSPLQVRRQGVFWPRSLLAPIFAYVSRFETFLR